MILNTFSEFIYGHTVTSDNQVIPLDEGNGEVLVEIPVGSYSLTSFLLAVNNALNLAGTLEYLVTVDRSTYRITIESNAPFDLLWNTSLNKEISARELLGFDELDLIGFNSYEAQNRTGRSYQPQFKLQNFIDFAQIKKSNNPTVRTTATGRVEVVKYSNNNFMSCDITLITNITGQGVIKNNPNGVEDAIDFMNYATDKLDIEFVYDVENPDNYVECILESTREGSDGTAFTLQPLYSRGLAGYYELTGLTFRKL